MIKLLKLLAVLIGMIVLYIVSDYVNFKENLLMSLNIIIGVITLVFAALYILSCDKTSRKC